MRTLPPGAWVLNVRRDTDRLVAVRGDAAREGSRCVFCLLSPAFSYCSAVRRAAMSRHASASRDSQHRCKRRSRHSPSQVRYHYRKSGRPAASSVSPRHGSEGVGMKRLNCCRGRWRTRHGRWRGPWCSPGVDPGVAPGAATSRGPVRRSRRHRQRGLSGEGWRPSLSLARLAGLDCFRG